MSSKDLVGKERMLEEVLCQYQHRENVIKNAIFGTADPSHRYTKMIVDGRIDEVLDLQREDKYGIMRAYNLQSISAFETELKRYK